MYSQEHRLHTRASFTNERMVYSLEHHLLTATSFTHWSSVYSWEYHLLTGASFTHRSIVYSPEHHLLTGASFTHQSINYSPKNRLLTGWNIVNAVLRRPTLLLASVALTNAVKSSSVHSFVDRSRLVLSYPSTKLASNQLHVHQMPL